jgi:alkylation response protein AidB-like acyl-CoA dehydrogenase
MNFEKSENQLMIAQMVRDFTEKEIRPHVMTWDESQEFPREVFRKMGELGLMGVLVPQEYGGSGLGYFEYISVIEEVAKVCGSIGLSVAAHNSLCTNHILEFANEEQKQKYLPKLATGEWIGAWGLTEANTGSDAMRMQVTAKQEGEYWVLNGAKNWITHGITGNVGDNGTLNDTRTAGSMSTEGDHSHTFTTGSTGSSGTNANLQPYITVAMWKRTA